MSIELGVALTLAETPAAPAELTALARHAEAHGLDLVVIVEGDAPGDEAGLDPWMAAAWVAGGTNRIQIGVPGPAAAPPDPTDPRAPYPAVVAKALDSLDLLAPGRVLAGTESWVTAPPGAELDTLSRLGAAGRPVVVPVGSMTEVERLAELVTERGTSTSAQPDRPAAVRARRLPGLDYEGVPASLRATMVEPGDPGYRAVASTYLRGGAPGLVLRPHTPAEVSDALGYARRHPDLPLGIRSAGHGISGRSTNQGGLVIDVGALNHIEVLDPQQRLVRIGPGATWKQVAAALHPYGWALGSGDYGGVGVGGLATAGGVGLLSRGHGLTIDHLRAVELVLADGSQVRASPQEHPDLFWAVRGAGANFGVATAFEFQVYPVGDVGWAQLTFISTDLTESLRRYGELASTAPRDTTVFLVTGRPRQGQSVIALYAVVEHPDPEVVIARLTPFTELGVLAQQQVVMTAYQGVMAMAADVGPAGQQGFGEPVSRSALLPALTDEVARDLTGLLHSGQVYFLQLRAMGGAIADVPAQETAFAYRDAAFQLTAMGADRHRLDQHWEPLRRHFDGLYLSFETDRSPQRLADAFPPPVLARLRALKQRYDPGSLFRDNFHLVPGSRLDPHLGTKEAAA